MQDQDSTTPKRKNSKGIADEEKIKELFNIIDGLKKARVNRKNNKIVDEDKDSSHFDRFSDKDKEILHYIVESRAERVNKIGVKPWFKKQLSKELIRAKELNTTRALGLCLMMLGSFLSFYSIGVISDIFGVVVSIPFFLIGFSLSFIFQKPKPKF
ncbi:MAG: hypothetical protein ACFFCW_32385 [Candidatus Hodarchaeota archaeon]